MVDSPPKLPEYDRLVLQALSAYDAGRWDEARRLFERAHGLEPTARTLRTIGMAAFNQGDYIAALQNLEAALVDARKPLTVEQRSHATQLIERANRELGRFRLRLHPESARLLVDGKSPTHSRDGELVLMPGRHELEVSAKDHETLASRLEVEPGDRTALELRLQPAASSAVAHTRDEIVPAPRPASLRRSGGSARRVWGVVALGVGGAALIASGVTASLALAQKSDLDAACPDRRCGPASYADVDRYDTLRVVSGATLAAGLLGAGIGAYLLISDGDSEEGSRIEAVLSPTRLTLRGRL